MTDIVVPWKSQSKVWWSETCADIMERFGLPGDKYVTEVTTDYMKFIFHDDRDALMCRLLISDKIC